MIESGMVGREGLIGGAVALGGDFSLAKAIVQIAATASVLPAERLRTQAEHSAGLRQLLFQHQQMVLAQAHQSAACNSVHSVEARLARWLLRCRDVHGTEDLAVTHEYLAEMLGVQRTSVSIVAHTLQQAGLIRYSRGHIRILDLVGLQAAACECYETIRMLSQRLLAPAGHHNHHIAAAPR